jgi:hypothetical protein
MLNEDKQTDNAADREDAQQGLELDPWRPLSQEQREEVQRHVLKFIRWVCVKRDPGFAPVAPRFREELNALLLQFESVRTQLLLRRMRIRGTEAANADDEIDLRRYDQVLSMIEVCTGDLFRLLRAKSMLDLNDIAGTSLMPFLENETA